MTIKTVTDVKRLSILACYIQYPADVREDLTLQNFTNAVLDFEIQKAFWLSGIKEDESALMDILQIGLCVCMCMWLQAEYLAFHIFKTNKDRNTKFYAQYQTSAKIIFPGFEENRKTGNGVGQTENETGSECLRNGSNDFLQIW